MSIENDLTCMAYVLFYKALDDNGEQLFDWGDKNALLNNVAREILVDVATQIMGQASIEDTKKN